jgi:hypothetical protein
VTGVLPEHSVLPGKVFWNYSRFSRFGKDEQATPTLFAVDSIPESFKVHKGFCLLAQSLHVGRLLFGTSG